MRKHDIVYIIKDNKPNDELRYSLRSVDKNLEHRKVWFYCGCPEDIKPDEHIEHKQKGVNKWERVRSSVIEICKNDKITKQFWLFNDDFYVLRPLESAGAFHRGLLKDHISDIEIKHGGMQTLYTKQLRDCLQSLRDAGLTALDYALHVPMLIDREKMLQALEMFPRCPMFRSIYGNYAQIGGEFYKDNKAFEPNDVIRQDVLFFSTANKAFAGNVRKQIEDLFPDVCKYEAEYNGESIREKIL